MKRKNEKKPSKIKSRLKYLLLLLLLSFNFSFAFVHINKLNEKINQLNNELATQQALINQTDSKLDLIQSAVTLHEMKINILSKADPGKVVHTIQKVIEQVPIEPANVHLLDPGVVLTTVASAGALVLKMAHSLGGVFH